MGAHSAPIHMAFVLSYTTTCATRDHAKRCVRTALLYLPRLHKTCDAHWGTITLRTLTTCRCVVGCANAHTCNMEHGWASPADVYIHTLSHVTTTIVVNADNAISLSRHRGRGDPAERSHGARGRS